MVDIFTPHYPLCGIFNSRVCTLLGITKLLSSTSILKCVSCHYTSSPSPGAQRDHFAFPELTVQDRLFITSALCKIKKIEGISSKTHFLSWPSYFLYLTHILYNIFLEKSRHALFLFTRSTYWATVAEINLSLMGLEPITSVSSAH